MNPRLSMLVVLLVPGLGPLACGERCTAVVAVLLAVVPLLCGLAWPYYVLAWVCAQLVALLFTANRG